MLKSNSIHTLTLSDFISASEYSPFMNPVDLITFKRKALCFWIWQEVRMLDSDVYRVCNFSMRIHFIANFSHGFLPILTELSNTPSDHARDNNTLWRLLSPYYNGLKTSTGSQESGVCMGRRGTAIVLQRSSCCCSLGRVILASCRVLRAQSPFDLLCSSFTKPLFLI